MKPPFMPFEKVLVRNSEQELWRPDFFWRYSLPGNKEYKTFNGYFKQCVPYLGHEDLLDTVTNPEKTEKFKKYDLVCVRDSEEYPWLVRVFSKFSSNSPYIFGVFGGLHSDGEEETMYFKYCKHLKMD